MKPNNRSLAAIVMLCILAAFSQTGCKETTIINAQLAPNIDHITVFDTTLPALTKSVIDSSDIFTSIYTGYPVYLAGGVINADPVFGKTNAGMYFQVVPTNLGLDFTKYTVDSAVLVIPYQHTVGDTLNGTSTQTYTVYRITDSFQYGKNYYPYTHFASDQANPLSSPVTVNVLALKDSVNVNGVNERPHLRIRLNSNFTNLITDPANSGEYADYPTFLNWFRGLYIQASDANVTQSLPYFQLDEAGGDDNYSKANVILYYHTTGMTDTLTQSFEFLTSLCAFTNEIKRNYTGYPVQPYLLPLSATGNSDIVFLQNMPGACIDFKIYNIKSIPLSVINQAQIVITIPSALQPPNFPQSSNAPPRIYAYGVNNTGDTITELIDKQPLGNSSLADYMDGYANLNPNTNVITYKLNIPRTLQSAITQGLDTLHLRVSGTTDYFGAYSMQAAGGNYSDPAVRLKMYVIYTKQK